MANAWHGTPSPGGPSQSAASFDPAMGRKERSSWMIPIALWIVALAIALAYVGFFYVVPIVFAPAISNALTKAFNNSLDQGMEQALQVNQSAGTAANDAADALGPQFGSLTLQLLNTRLPKYQWVDGATNVLYPAERPIVSMTATGTHIETAIRVGYGFCSFGLTITSNTDPLTTEDHVAGLGKYYHLVGPGTYWQTVDQAPQCVADQAPTSGWNTWPGSLSSFGTGS
jgi:hypothetical protein